MFGLSTLYTKLIIGAIIAAIFGGGLFYVWHLQHENTQLHVQTAIQKQDIQNKDDTITETDRRTKVADDIDNLMSDKRNDNEKTYQKKINKVEQNVQAGNDREVGPLLRDYFNNGL